MFYLILLLSMMTSLWASPTGITHEEFNEAIDKVEDVFRPMVEAKGEKLIVYRKWEFNLVNAFAGLRSYTKERTVEYYRGLAELPDMTLDAFTIVVCHEFGHHLGGKPLSTLSDRRWASVEGQADYWASSVCLKKAWEHEDNASIVSSMTAPLAVKTECSKQWQDQNEANICIRSIMAGTTFGKIFNAKMAPLPSFATPSTELSTTTLESHPSGQCRLDSIAQAALNRPRPLCWF